MSSLTFLTDEQKTKKRDDPVSFYHTYVRSKKHKHINEAIFTHEDKVNDIAQFIEDIAYLPTCVDNLYKISSSRKCTCNKQLQDPIIIGQIAEFLATFSTLEPHVRKMMVVEWMKSAISIGNLTGLSHSNDPIFNTPGATGVDSESNQILICKHTLAKLISYKRGKWNSCWDVAIGKTDGESLVHGAKGRLPNNVKQLERSKDLLHDFFAEMKLLSEPRATRAVQLFLANGGRTTVLRDDAEDAIVDLPSHMTKRELYRRMALDKFSFKVEFNQVGVLKKKEFIGDGDSSNPPPLVNWSTFLKFWKEHYSEIRIQRPRKDICGECYKYYHEIRLTPADNAPVNAIVNNDIDSHVVNQNIQEWTEEEEAKEEEKEEMQREEEEETEEVANDPIDEGTHVLHPQILAPALKHSTMAQDQRNVYNELKVKVKDQRGGNEKKVAAYTIDFCKNGTIPLFNEEQPGETYYYSPMTVNILGIYDFEKDMLKTYVYLEGEGKKGGNNVASLLMKYLKVSLGDTITDGPIDSLYLFFDNCGGQNKNKYVIRLLNLIVLSGIARNAYAIFLIKGHTKNDCDSNFNLLKIKTRNMNIYTPDQMMECFNSSEKVSAELVDSSVFFDWGKYGDDYLRDDVPGVSKQHVFHVNECDPYSMNMSEWWNSETGITLDMRRYDIVQQGPMGHVFRLDGVLLLLVPPGLRDIKRIEMFDKFGPLIPEHIRKTWYIYCVDPGEEIRKGVKVAKKKSKELKEKVSETFEEEKEEIEDDDVMICSETNMGSIPTILTSIEPQEADIPIDI